MTASHRRGFLQRLAGLPLVGAWAGRGAAAKAPDYLASLGVRPIINGAGVYTMFTASLMWPEVVEAIQQLSTRFVRISELHDAVGKRIAQMLNVEAAMVPSGAAAALTVGTAACITGTDPDKIQRIPDLTGMKNEVIVQKTHRFPYDHMVRNCGIRLVEVDTREQLERAIGPQTAMLLFLNKSEPLGQVKMKEFVEIGKRHGIPTFNDAAADVPPLENLTRPIQLGFDLIAVSGGKGIRGPQSAGLLLGRADLIHAARLNTSPYSDTIGRSCKVNKEELVGMMVAVEKFLKQDFGALDREWERRARSMIDTLRGIPTLQAERFVPVIANQVPHVRLTWDETRLGLTPAQLMQQLRDGEPSIELVPSPPKGTVEISTWMLQPGEAEIVARRIREIFGARKG